MVLGVVFMPFVYSGMPDFENMTLDLGISIFFILLFTAGILMVWTYGSIVPRMTQLIRAANRIKEGDLDFEIDTKGEDEISELCAAFDEMRQRLLEDAKEKIQAENDQRQLISNIAHDLKTPLTAISGYAEGLVDGVADTPEKQKKYLTMISHKAGEMNTLLNELTLYSKIDTNRIPYNFNHVYVGAYFMDCAQELGLELEEKGVGLSSYNFVEDSVEMIADPEQIRRVIHNIINNSVKYKADRPLQIGLTVRDVGDFVQVELEDNGRGIPPEDLPHIFDRTYRGDASRNSSIGGSGIGLSIAKKIITEHGGQIWATSRNGYGTVMYFVLRKYKEEEA